MCSSQSRTFLLLTVSLVTSFAYKLNEHEQASVKETRKYVKREVDPCNNEMCNDSDGYPIEEIDNIVEKNNAFKNFFGNIIRSDDSSYDSSLGLVWEENLCPIQQVDLLPRKAQDSDGVWQTIVNTGKYQQILEIEDCMPGAKSFAENFMLVGYVTKCETKRKFIRMVIVTEDGELKLGEFSVPVGCYSSVKMDDSDK